MVRGGVAILRNGWVHRWAVMEQELEIMHLEVALLRSEGKMIGVAIVLC